MIKEVLNGSWIPIYQYSLLGFIAYIIATLIIELAFMYVWFRDSKEIKKIIVCCLAVNLLSGFIGFLIYFMSMGSGFL